MERFKKQQITLYYRMSVIFISFIFILISGCRSRSVDKGNNSVSADTVNTDDKFKQHPEYGGPPSKWEEIPEELPADEVKTPVKTTPEEEVKQPDPGPMEPASAYGTNTNFNKPTVIQPNN